MNILYGVAGEGFGHSSRAMVVANYLEKRGHKVLIMTYGQGYEVLKNKFKVFRVSGLRLIFERSVLKKRKTFFYNLTSFPKNVLLWRGFKDIIENFKPDLCISDFEPIVPIISNWFDLPLLSIDNQHRITNLDFHVPERYKKDFIISKMVVGRIISDADNYIISSFGDSKIKKAFRNKTFVVPPIVRDDVIKLKPFYGDKILVYLTKKDSHVLRILGRIKEKFVLYGYNKNFRKGNIEFKTKESFLKDLQGCKAIIASSGFSLMSEALYLKKPYLALPLKGQFEQVLNSLFLKESGFGDYSEKLKENEVKEFLENFESFCKNLKSYHPSQKMLLGVLDRILKGVKKR
ncbi:MAG: glycosyltransferase family protein [archaeon]